MPDKIVCNWNVQIMTPVHVGGAQDKHYQTGVDFLIRNGKVYFLNSDLVIERIGIDDYSQALLKGNLHERLNYKNLEELSLSVKTISGKTREIRQCVKNQLTGRPILPGSSIKGAIRSVIFKYLYQGNNHRGNESSLFGGISKDFMRFVQVTDVEFEETEIFNTKIYNVTEKNGNWRSNWKHQFRGHNSNTTTFNDYQFTTGYECLKRSQVSMVRITFNQMAYVKALEFNEVQQPKGLDSLLSNDFENILFTTIQSHTRDHVQKEIEFLTSHQNYYQKAQNYESLLEDYSADYKAMMNRDLAPIRMAAGSGFHSITGDWKFDTHEIDQITYFGSRSRGQYLAVDSAKSRKFAFKKDEEDYYFYPMGYVAFSMS